MDGPTDQIDASVVSLLPTAAFGPPNLILNGPAPADSYTLINNTGGDAVAGTFNNLPQGASLAVSGKAFYINYKGGDGNDVVITTSPVPQNLVWNPQGGSDVWDYTTPNWLNIDSNTQTVFRDGDNVTFNDLSQGDVDIIGGGTTSTPQSVAPASTSFANNNDYSLFGGSLAGPGGLTKSGAGDLALSSNCTYAGSTDVNGGRLILGVAALPDLTAVTVSAGATLVDRGDGALFNGVEATIGSLAGSGTVVLDSFQWALITGANNSSTTFSGIISGNTELAKVGAGTFTIAGDQPNTFYKLDIGYFTPSGSAINGGTVVLDKADGVTAVGAEPGAANNGITVYAGNLTWAADNQLLTTDDVGAIGQSCGIDLGSHTDTFANLGLGADTFHIGSGGVLNLVDSAWGDEAPATWTIDQGAALNFLDGGSAPYVNYRLALGAGYGTSGPVDLNVAGTINIGNSPGIDAASFGDATVNVTGTGSINTGSGAVAVAGNVTLPASENPPNVIVQSGGQINIGKFGDGGSLQLLGHQEGGAVDNPGSLFLDTGATLNMEGDSSIREIGGHLDDAIHGGGIIDLFGAEHMVSAGDVNSGLTISVNIVDGTLTKSGPGWLALSGSNQFDGATTIQQGMLVLESDSALGNTTHVYIDDGGTLELHGHNISAPIDATGIGSQSRGALSNSSNSFWGPGQPATITGTLTLSGTVGVDGDEPIHLDGQVTGTGEISLGNFPTLVLSNSANDYTGGNTNANRAFGAPTFDVAAPHALGTGVLSLIGGFLTLDSPSDQVTASSVSLAPANLGGSVGLPNLIVNGPAPADSYTLVNNTGSAAVAGTFNDLPQGASLTIGGKTFYINYKGGDGNDVVITTSPVQNSVQNVQGMVWADFNNDGNVDFGEQGISGVPITLIGSSGQLVATTSTDSNGLYSFNNVPPDVYSISEGGSPSGYVEGKDTLGSITDLEGNLVASSVGDASVQDLFSGVPVGINENAINYNFGEQPAAGSAVSKGQAATMGFWQNKNGQALINEFNSIGPWLAATMPQTFGSLASASPQQVATLYQQKFVLTDKLDAQVMATALNVYATDASLGGSAATSYGFAVSTYGLGDSTWNVGSDGGALDAADNSTLTVLQILQDWDQEPDKTSRSIRQMAIDIFGGINKTGNI